MVPQNTNKTFIGVFLDIIWYYDIIGIGFQKGKKMIRCPWAFSFRRGGPFSAKAPASNRTASEAWSQTVAVVIRKDVEIKK